MRIATAPTTQPAVDAEWLRQMSYDVLAWIDKPFTTVDDTSSEWFQGPQIRTSWHDQLAWFAPARRERHGTLLTGDYAQEIIQAAPQLRSQVAAAAQAVEGWLGLIERLTQDTTERPIDELRETARVIRSSPGPELTPILELASALMREAGGPAELGS